MSDFLQNLNRYIKNFLKDWNSKSYNSYQLFKQIKYWHSNKIFPKYYELPDYITLSSEFWKKIIKLYKDTNQDFRERAVAVLWIDGEWLFNYTKTGDQESVRGGGKISLEYKPSSREGYSIREFYIDDKLESRVEVYNKKIPQKHELEYLFNLHTHPKHIENESQYHYNFFSSTDIKTFLSNNVVVTGLITDKLYLLARTNETPTYFSENSENITPETLFKEYKILCYSGEFYKKLYKINSPV